MLAILLKTKSKKLKELALPSFISAIFGVTEPATYGITMPRKKMFALCCVGGAASGVVVALANLSMETYAGMGIIGLLGFINPEAPNFVGIVLMAVVPFVVSLALGLVMYKDSDYEELNAELEGGSKASGEKKENGEKLVSQTALAMPADGKVEALSTSSDEAFSSEILGKGCLILPENGNVYAPCDGVVRTAVPHEACHRTGQ